MRTPAPTPAPGRTPASAPRKRRRRVLPIVLIVIGVALLLTAGGIFVHALLGYRQAVETYDELASYAPITDDEGSGVPVVDFDSLQAINPDVVAWIYVPGTSINYPVVQGDDNSTYLNKLFDGTSNSSGSIFLDADDTAPGMVDMQTTLYGHHMNNRTMFYEIDDTTDQSAFDQIEVVYYITPETTYRCTPLMTSVVPDTFVNARTPNFDGTAALTSYLRELEDAASVRAADLDDRIGSVTRVLSLITCSSEIPTSDRTVMALSVDEEYPSVGAAAQTGADASATAGDATAGAADAAAAAPAEAAA